jgi:acyl dehydratase
MATILDGEAGLRAAVGQHLGYSDWLIISGEQLQQFTAATGDPDATYLAVGLSNLFLPQIVTVEGFAMGINYGTEAVRLAVALNPGDRVRGGARLNAVTEIKGGVQSSMSIVVETDADEIVCSIESISRWLQ